MASFWLVDFGTTTHAIEAEEGLHLHSSPALTALPFSHTALAGMTILDDQTLLVADLAACLGFPPANHSPAAHLLRFQGETKGFLVAARPHLRELGDGLILPLPEIANTRGQLRGCLLIEGEPVPMLDLRRMQAWISGSGSSSTEEPAATPSEPLVNEGCRWRLVNVAGGETFALPASLFPSSPCPRPAVAALARMPAGMSGICIHNGEALTVWSLVNLLGETGPVEETLLLSGKTGIGPVGVLAGKESGETVTGSPLPLPPWGRRPGINEALLLEGRAIPCLEVEGLLRRGHTEGFAGSEDHAPSPAVLPQGEWEVTEFSISGKHHAVPKGETVEILEPLPWTRVPGLSPLVEGVAWWEGAFWPVVNLSCYFGPPIAATEAGCMIALKRGRHRLLLLAERFNGYRHIPPGEQRHLPLQLPHPLVSGCYLADQAVVLLLDAPALVHHFDSALLRTFRKAVGLEESPLWSQSTSSPGETCSGDEPEELETSTPATGSELVEDHSEKPQQLRESVNSEAKGLVGDHAVQFPSDNRQSESGDWIPDSCHLKPSEAFSLEAGEPVSTEESQAEKDEHDLPAGGENKVASVKQSPPVARQMGRKAGSRSSGSIPRSTKSGSVNPKWWLQAAAGLFLTAGLAAGWFLLQKPAVSTKTLQVERPRISARAPESKQETAVQSTLEKAPESEEWPKLPSEKEVTENQANLLPPEPAGQEEDLQEPGLPGSPGEGLTGKLPRGAGEGLAVVQPEASVPQAVQPAGEKTPQEEPEVPPEMNLAEKQPSPAVSAPLEPALEEEAESKEVLDLSPSPSMGVAGDLSREFEDGKELEPAGEAPSPPGAEMQAPYIVQKGDTLWTLSERFLDSPYYYGDLARENRIPNPDVIFPGQVLEVEKKPEPSSNATSATNPR